MVYDYLAAVAEIQRRYPPARIATRARAAPRRLERGQRGIRRGPC